MQRVRSSRVSSPSTRLAHSKQKTHRRVAVVQQKRPQHSRAVFSTSSRQAPFVQSSRLIHTKQSHHVHVSTFNHVKTTPFDVFTRPFSSFRSTRFMMDAVSPAVPPVVAPNSTIHVAATDSVPPASQVLTLQRVFTDLQLPAFLPLISSRPMPLPSINKAPDAALTLHDLFCLDAPDIRALLPNDVSRNRIKEYLRGLTKQGFVADGEEPISQDKFQQILEALHLNQIVDSHATTSAATAAAVATATATNESQQHQQQHEATAQPTQQQQQHVDEQKKHVDEQKKQHEQQPEQQPEQKQQQEQHQQEPQQSKEQPPQQEQQQQPEEQQQQQQQPPQQEQHQQQEPTSDAAAAPAPAAAAPAAPHAPTVEQAHATESLQAAIQRLDMPTFFDNMKQGTVQEWHVKIGEHFERGQVLCEIDTDIAELGFEAPEPGHLSEILVPAGGIAKVGDPIAVMRYREDNQEM